MVGARRSACPERSRRVYPELLEGPALSPPGRATGPADFLHPRQAHVRTESCLDERQRARIPHHLEEMLFGELESGERFLDADGKAQRIRQRI